MNTYIFKLKFKGPVHFGDTGIDLENVQPTITSDTLFSALVNALSANLGNQEADKFISDFQQKFPFLVSSLFPYVGNVYYLPKPLDDSFIDKDVKRKAGKELKKLIWLENHDFLRWLKREDFNENDIFEIRQKQKKYYDVEIRPRVVIDRITSQTAIYHCSYLYYSENAGLYGIVYFKDSTYFEKFKMMLNLLSHTGLGGEKTYGCGLFEYEISELDSAFKAIFNLNSEFYVLLSLFHPDNDEVEKLNDMLVCYNFVRKKGWISSGRQTLTLKRKSVGFITEGSVVNQKIRGKLVDVTPDNISEEVLKHKVFRYGYALTAPFRGVE